MYYRTIQPASAGAKAFFSLFAAFHDHVKDLVGLCLRKNMTSFSKLFWPSTSGVDEHRRLGKEKFDCCIHKKLGEDMMSAFLDLKRFSLLGTDRKEGSSGSFPK